MLNYIWAFMIIAGIVYGTVTGRIQEVGDGLLEGGGEAVSLCITMFGIITIWTGLMNIAQKSGLINSMEKKIRPFIYFLFPGVKGENKASQYISTNIIANFCGLGWAATPAGLKAMEELGRIQDQKAGHHVENASDDMCAFLVVNISSIQLIPVNIIAYRAKFGSVNPTAIIIPGIIATAISTLAGVIFCMIKREKRY